MDFNLIRAAGLTLPEAAEIIGVSHVSVWKYINGEAVPRTFVRGTPVKQRCEVLLHLLSVFIGKGNLPKPGLAFVGRVPAELVPKRKALVDRLKKLVDERVDNSPANT